MQMIPLYFLLTKILLKAYSKLLYKFKQVSGLTVNMEKTEGIWLGKDSSFTDTPFNIKWQKKPVKAQGVYLSNNAKQAENANFEDKIKKLECQLCWWKARGLSFHGRILITKAIGLSQFTYLANIIHTPEHIISQVNTLIYNVIWKSKCDKVKRDIMIQSYENGGLKCEDFGIIVEAAKIVWIKSFLQGPETDWKATFAEF